MRLPPFTAHVIALAHGGLVGATLLIAAVALVAMLLASRRVPSAPEDVDEPLKRLGGFHIFGPEEDDEPAVHVPVLRTRGTPVAPARPAAAEVRTWEDASRALDRIAAFAVRQPYAPAPSAPAPAPPPASAPAPAAPALSAAAAATVRWNALPALQPSVDAEPARSLPVTADLANPGPPAPQSDRRRGELPLDGDILLVEDDAAIADLYRLLLHTRGYATRHAHDGVEGVAMVREERPALILLDMMMPRMDGIQFLEALRSWPKTSAIPVVVLTNTENVHLVDRAMSLGAVEYLVKAQMRPQVLVGALPHWLRGNRALSSVS